MVNDFEPVALLAGNPQMIVAKKTVPANNLKELIAWLKANPDKGPGHGRRRRRRAHQRRLFPELTGTSFSFVPYRGAGPALQDLIGGQIDLIFDQAANSLPRCATATSRPRR